MVPICCRGSENRPAADVVQEGELGVHQAGQQGDLHHKSGRQSLSSRNTAGRCEISSARSRTQTVHTLDGNQQLVISERERRREWINNVVCLNYIMYLHVLFFAFFQENLF